VQKGIAATEIPIGSNIVSTRLSASERTARRQRYGYRDDDLVVGFFGFLNQSKGALDLLEAIHLLNQMRAPVHLLMIGDQRGASDPTNVAYSRKVEAQIQRYGLSRQIRWTGAMPDLEVAADLNGCDVLLLPFRDGASLRRGTLMAALANGCAIVTTTPQAPIVELKEGRDLLYTAVGDSQAMAAAVLRVADDRALRASLQNNARKVSRRFDWDEIARRHLDVYSSSLERAEVDRKPSLFGFWGRPR
jgi:glycosyltransferase involved in cell wall biosynthesis